MREDSALCWAKKRVWLYAKVQCDECLVIIVIIMT